MWTRTLAASLALALTAPAGACTATPATSDVPADSGAPAPSPGTAPAAGAAQPAAGLTVRVALSADTVREGETLRVIVTVANGGRAAQGVEATSACFTDYEILDAGGAVVATADRMCAAVMSQRTLAPGESFEESHAWVRGLRGMAVLPPGDYRVRGVLLAAGGAVRSAPLPVVVTP